MIFKVNIRIYILLFVKSVIHAFRHSRYRQLWRNRWVKLQDISLDDLSIEERLQDAPRPGAPAKITADQRCQIEAPACEKPENSERPITQWSARENADEVIKREIVTEISPCHAARLLKRRWSQAAPELLLVDTGL